MSFKSLYLDDNIRVAAKACTGTEHHVAEITAFLVKEPGYSVLPERRRMLVQEPLPFFVSKVVNVTNSFFPDIAAVIAAAHIVLMQIYESNRFAGATWSGHQLFLFAFAIAAQEQPALQQVGSPTLSTLASSSADFHSFQANAGRVTSSSNWRKGGNRSADECRLSSVVIDLYKT